jgi:hypothetical protein
MCIAVHVFSVVVWSWPIERGLIGCSVLKLQFLLIHTFVVNQPQQNICRDATDSTQQLLWLFELQCSTAQLLQYGTPVELDTQHQLNVRQGVIDNPFACS